MKLSALKVNAAAIEAGRWVDVPDFPGLALNVRGINNADYRKMSTKLRDAVPRAERIKGIDSAKSDEMMTTLLVETVLVGWRGLEDDDGKPLAFTKEAASTLLSDPNYGRFREAVLWAATVVGEDDLAATEDDAKN